MPCILAIQRLILQQKLATAQNQVSKFWRQLLPTSSPFWPFCLSFLNIIEIWRWISRLKNTAPIDSWPNVSLPLYKNQLELLTLT
jgi:hypothetical protein